MPNKGRRRPSEDAYDIDAFNAQAYQYHVVRKGGTKSGTEGAKPGKAPGTPWKPSSYAKPYVKPSAKGEYAPRKSSKAFTLLIVAAVLAAGGVAGLALGLKFWPRTDSLSTFGNNTGTIAPTVRSSSANEDPTDICAGIADCFEGWGTSLAWDSIMLSTISEAARDAYMEAVFDAEKGLGLTYLRYNIGGGENPDPHHFQGMSTSHFQWDARIPGFQPRPGVWDWTADMDQRWMLLEARRRGANIFEAYASGPPYWMTYSNCSAGQYQPAVNNLRDDMYPAFADYITEVVRFFQTDPSLNVTFRNLAPLNEPTGVWWVAGNRQEGCYFDAPAQRRMIAATAASLRAKNLTGTTLSVVDDFDVPTTITSVQGLDDNLLTLVSHFSAHGYGDASSDIRSSLASFAQSKGKRMAVTEYGCCLPERSDGLDKTDLGRALITARQIQIDLVSLKVSAWLIWQPSWTFLKTSFDGITLLKPYHALRHFSQFIRPGSQILQSNDPDTVAAVSREGDMLILVVVNMGQAALPKSYQVATSQSQTSQNSTIAGTQYRTDYSTNFVKSQFTFNPTKRFQLTIPRESITTLLLPVVPVAST